MHPESIADSAVYSFVSYSIIIYSSTGLGCKLACNAGSALSNFVLQHPDLVPAETLGFVTSVTTSQKAVCVKVMHVGSKRSMGNPKIPHGRNRTALA